MVERWTRQRRVEHTRSLLVDAAEDVFARKGFDAATLDDIADTAGYTRGAIYANFGAKEDLFLAVSDRYWRRYFENFTEVLASVAHIGEVELDQIANRWRQISETGGAQHAALGYEFTLYLLRNPDAKQRVAAKRQEVVEELTDFIVRGIAQLGVTLRIPATTFAHILISTSDAVILCSRLEDDVDLYRPMLELYMSALVLDAPKRKSPRRR
ncbi:MAG: TetR/AcrR family transcriptional regulator [Mycobacterium sp.]